MPLFRQVKSKKRSKRYDKVTHKVKIQLLKRVLCDSKEIKEVVLLLFRLLMSWISIIPLLKL